MKLTLTGSLGNIGKPLTQTLVAAGHDVTVISSEAARQEAIEALGAKAAIGTLDDAAFLTRAFAGADAVFAMTPPIMHGSGVIPTTVRRGEALADAIGAAGVKRVVMLSSIGADLPGGTGPIAGLHAIEDRYRRLDGVSVTLLRAGYFFTNFYGDVAMIKGAGILGSNFPADAVVPYVHVEDIAAAVAEALAQTPAGTTVRYIVSDVRTPGDAARVLGAAVGKPELPWVEFSDEQALQGMKQAGLPDEMAGLYAEMGAAMRAGALAADFQRSGAPVTGTRKLEDFAREFAAAF